MSAFHFTEFVDPNDEAGGDRTPKPPTTPPRTKCDRTPTLVNGMTACQGELIFEENFNTLDAAKWEHDVRIAGSPVSGGCFLRRQWRTSGADARMCGNPQRSIRVARRTRTCF
jgi:hypothetical protein